MSMPYASKRKAVDFCSQVKKEKENLRRSKMFVTHSRTQILEFGSTITSSLVTTVKKRAGVPSCQFYIQSVEPLHATAIVLYIQPSENTSFLSGFLFVLTFSFPSLCSFQFFFSRRFLCFNLIRLLLVLRRVYNVYTMEWWILRRHLLDRRTRDSRRRLSV